MGEERPSPWTGPPDPLHVTRSRPVDGWTSEDITVGSGERVVGGRGATGENHQTPNRTPGSLE